MHVRHEHSTTLAPRVLVSVSAGLQASTVARPAPLAQTRVLVERIVSRERRLEPGTHAPRSTPWLPPILRVIVRGGHAPIPPAPARHADQLASGGTRPGATPSREGPRPPVDVNRLADDVIRVIDRRIIAERERLGRI